MRWTRRDALKTFGTGAAMLAMPASLRSALAAQEPELVLRLVAAPARLPIRAGSETRGDTFGIFAGERVRIQLAPTVPGLFTYHCHNLEHEDGGMMRNCRFGSASS